MVPYPRCSIYFFIGSKLATYFAEVDGDSKPLGSDTEIEPSPSRQLLGPQTGQLFAEFTPHAFDVLFLRVYFAAWEAPLARRSFVHQEHTLATHSGKLNSPRHIMLLLLLYPLNHLLP